VRRLALLAATFALAALAAGMIVQAPTAQTTSQEANAACRSGGAAIPAADLPETVELEDCPIGGRVITDHGIGTVLPAPGQSIYVEAVTTGGAQELEVVRYRDGTVELEYVGDESQGAQEEPAIAPAATRPGDCSDRAYTDLDYRVESTLSWYFNPDTTPNELTRKGAENAIRAGGANITNTKNNCRLGDRVPRENGLSYGGPTSAHAQLSENGRCLRPDNRTVVSFGSLPKGALAVHCTVMVVIQGGYNSVRASDIMINKAHYNWTTRPGARSCKAQYDLESVVTHEHGHTFGLGHVSEASHGSLTMSERINGTCQSSERTLGRGDVLGLDRKYR
jgi:Matrixin